MTMSPLIVDTIMDALLTRIGVLTERLESHRPCFRRKMQRELDSLAFSRTAVAWQHMRRNFPKDTVEWNCFDERFDATTVRRAR
jgi:hypothetical protein